MGCVDSESGREIHHGAALGHKACVEVGQEVGRGLLAVDECGEVEIREFGECIGQFLGEFAVSLYLDNCLTDVEISLTGR